MNTQELQDLLETLASLPETVSPYGMHKVVNDLLGVHLPPQMFYNYIGNGYITATKDQNGKWRVTRKEVRRWTEKYALQNIVSSVS
jgi:predicted site-specific integrase-resolvase